MKAQRPIGPRVVSLLLILATMCSLSLARRAEEEELVKESEGRWKKNENRRGADDPN